MKKLLLLLILTTAVAQAQWQQLPSSESSGFNQMIEHNNVFYAATTGGVYKSTDGSFWQASMNGLYHRWVSVIYSDGLNLYAGTERNTAYISQDNGATWNLFFSNNNNAGKISGFAVTGSSVFVSVDGNYVWRTDDNGTTWIQFNGSNGLPTTNIIGLHVYQNILFAFTTLGIYKSSDLGLTWISANNGLPNSSNLSFLKQINGVFYTYRFGQLSVSTDLCDTWQTSTANGIDPNAFAYSIDSLNGQFYLTSTYGLYASADFGVTWTNPVASFCKFIQVFGQEAFLTGFRNGSSGLFRSPDPSQSWIYSSIDVVANKSGTIKAFDSGRILTDRYDGAAISVNNGSSFAPLTAYPHWRIDKLIDSDTLFAVAPGTNGAYFFSADQGVSFQTRSTNVSENNFCAMLRIGNLVLAGSAMNGIYRSTDYGNSFTQISGTGSAVKIHDFASLGSSLFAATPNGILISSDQGQTWNTTSVTNNVSSLAVSQNVIMGAGYNVIHRSSDGGNTWSPVNVGPGTLEVYALKTIGNKILAGTRLKGVLMSGDDGLSWQQANQGLMDTTMNINCIAYNSTDVYIGTEGAGMFRRSLSDLNITLTTGLSAGSAKSDFVVAPNPFERYFTINSVQRGRVELFTLTGQHVAVWSKSVGAVSFDTGHIAPGIYLLVFTSEDGSREITKIVKS